MTKKNVSAKRAGSKRAAKQNNLDDLMRLAQLGSGARAIRDGLAVADVLRESLSVDVTDRTTLKAFDAAMRLLRDGLASVEAVVDQNSTKFREAR